MTGPTAEQLFRTNVSWAKMGFAPKKLQEYRAWFEAHGIPAMPDVMEQAALELLGLAK